MSEGENDRIRPEDLHELISFEDPVADRTWVFDVTFLTSGWSCIFGQGCKGVHDVDTTELSQGCCSHGAHLVDEADIANLKERAARLTPTQWEMHDRVSISRLTTKNEDGVRVT